MKILGLGHYSRTGKDSLANFIIAYVAQAYRTAKVIKRPFAWKLKQICFELYGWAGMMQPEFYETQEGEPYRDVVLPAIGKTPVQIWVDMGTPAVRNCVYQDTWIDYLLKTDHDCDLLIIPDVRFANEVAAVKALGGTICKIVRPGYGPRPTVADRALVGFTGWDYVIGGVGTMDSLNEWATLLAGWQLGNKAAPVQTADERASANAVEVIEPWTPPSAPAAPSGLTVDVELAAQLLNLHKIAIVHGCVGLAADVLAKLVPLVPLLAAAA